MDTAVLAKLQSLVPSSAEADWHQHPNGMGWVYKTATAAPTSFIGPGAVVYGNARVSDSAQVFGNARVSGNAKVSNSAVVSGNAQVSGRARVFGYAQVSNSAVVSDRAQVSGMARVFGYAQVFGYARVSDRAQVSGMARVYDGIWNQSPLYIQGTRHALTHCAPRTVMVGCRRFYLPTWRETYEAVGRESGYSEAEIAEYALYLELAERRDLKVFPTG